jgi:hypothetical protein
MVVPRIRLLIEGGTYWLVQNSRKSTTLHNESHSFCPRHYRRCAMCKHGVALEERGLSRGIILGGTTQDDIVGPWINLKPRRRARQGSTRP